MNMKINILYFHILIVFMPLFLEAFESQSKELRGFSFFSPRSQSTDAARDSVGWHRFIHRSDTDEGYGAAAFTLEYTRSFRPHRLAEYFFGSDIITITGSENENRSQVDMLADYFGLSPGFASIVMLKPMLQNLIGDFNLFLGYQSWYFSVHAPAVWTSTQFNLAELVKLSGADIPFPAGYMSVGAIPAPYTDWISAMQGLTGFGEVQKLNFGKIACGKRIATGLSEIQLVLGYDLVNREDGHAGFNVRLSIPTGTRPTSEFLFVPIVGNGKHWEAGLGFSGKIIVWEKDGDQRADFFFDINAMHFFKSRQQRSFDFCKNGFASRYILLKEFNDDGMYTGVSLPAINITTVCCDVWNAIQFDFILMFGYQCRGFNFDIGYNGWIRSKEKICILEDPFARAHFGIKGIQNVISNNTQSTATINGDLLINQAAVADPNSPVFIQPNSLFADSAASPLQFTNAIFWHFSYAWLSDNYITPFVGLGGKVEFEGIRPKEVLPNKNSLSQWGFWAKGGLAW